MTQHKTTIGVVGKGFVGNAVFEGFQYPKMFCDSIYHGSVDIDEVAEKCHFIFLCLPAPTTGGKVDHSIIYNVLADISRNKNKNDPIILLKSTLLPSNLRALRSSFSDLTIVYNPEFLTARNADEDFKNQNFVLFGYSNRLTVGELTTLKSRLENMYITNSLVKTRRFIHTNYDTASMLKYTLNSFLPLKVIFFNELFDLVNNMNEGPYNVDWDTIQKGLTLDERVGPTHREVPGPDGKQGYGGACFPKDVEAFLRFSSDQETYLSLLGGAHSLNSIKYGRDKET